MKRRIIAYTAAELEWIESHCTLPRREAHAAFCETFGRDDVSYDNFKALCTRRGWSTGRDGRIQPGQLPWNTGKAMPYNANAARTQFKKGQTPRNAKYVGHERIDKKDGYVWMNVQETNPHTGYARRYVLKHKYLWEQKHGHVPRGMCLKCLDGDRTNTDPSNWDLVPRGVSALLNGRWAHGLGDVPASLKPLVLTLAKLKYQRKQATKKGKAK